MGNITKKRSFAAVLAVLMLMSIVLSGCGAATAEKPASLGSAGSFNSWFTDGNKSLTNRETPGTYYFKATRDFKLNDMGVIDNGHRVVIDLDGHTLTGKNAKKVQAFTVSEGASLTLMNGGIQLPGADDDGGLIKVEGSNSRLNLINVTLTNSDDSLSEGKNGGVLSVTSPVEGAPAVVTVQGTSVINGATNGSRHYGGSIQLGGNAELYMMGGVIQNGQAGVSGNVHMKEKAKFYLYDGIISGGVALRTSETTGLGGNVNVRGQARFHMYGGTVTGGTAEKNGGNFFVSSFGVEDPKDGFCMFGGTVEKGFSSFGGGNIYASEDDSVLKLYGGQIVDGKSTNGGNIYLERGQLKLLGGKLLGMNVDNPVNACGGNVFSQFGTIEIYEGIVRDAVTSNSGANIYATDSRVDIYGGSITDGSTAAIDVANGGGNLFVGGDSVFNFYDGEILNGESNRDGKKDVSAAGGNVVVAGKTLFQMFDGLIKDGIVHGNICRGGGVYVYGQGSNSDVKFHMYGGKIENDVLDTETMRGMGIGSYSATKGRVGDAMVRIFDGVINFLGSEKDKDRRHMLYGNASNLVVYDEIKYQGLTRGAQIGPCEDPGHNTETEKVAATCVTPAYTKYTCPTCGDWCQVTDKATGHTETTNVVAPTCTQPGYTEHNCEHCGTVRVTDITAPVADAHVLGEDGHCTAPGCTH